MALTAGKAAAPTMDVQTANALVTGAPIVEAQLWAAREHFRQLAELLTRSGPRFANAHRDAVNSHNPCVRRLKESQEDALVRERRARERAAGLTELSVE